MRETYGVETEVEYPEVDVEHFSPSDGPRAPHVLSVGAIEPAKKIEVAVYDETGALVQTEGYTDGPRAAAGFSPTSSGQYYVLVDLVEGNESSVCLVYSYK